MTYFQCYWVSEEINWRTNDSSPHFKKGPRKFRIGNTGWAQIITTISSSPESRSTSLAQKSVSKSKTRVCGRVSRRAQISSSRLVSSNETYSSQQSCIVIEVKKQEELEIWSPFKTSITEKSEAHPNCPTEKWNAKIWWFSHPQSSLKIESLKSGHHHHCCPPVRMKAGAFGRWGHKNVK